MYTTEPKILTYIFIFIFIKKSPNELKILTYTYILSEGPTGPEKGANITESLLNERKHYSAFLDLNRY